MICSSPFVRILIGLLHFNMTSKMAAAEWWRSIYWRRFTVRMLAAFASGCVAGAGRSAAQDFSWSELSLGLPISIKVCSGTAAGPIHAWYAQIDYADTLLAARAFLSGDADGKEGTRSLAQKVKAYVAVNGGFFGGTPAQSYSLVVSDGVLSAKQIQSVSRTQGTYYLTRANFAVKNDRTFETAWIYHFGNTVADIYRFAAPLANTTTAPAPAPQRSQGTVWSNLSNVIGGGPNLVSNGQVNVTYDPEVMFGSGVGLDNGDPRTAVGYTAAGKLILFVVDGRSAESIGMSLPQVAQTMLNLGCVAAINLDGGGSSTLVAGGSLLNHPSDGTERQVASFFAVVPLPAFSRDIDTNDPNYAEQGAGWTTTGNPGSFGQPARIHPVGTGTNRASFRLSLPREASYEVYAWWVASNNRAKDTPYLIYSKGKTDTVRVDQTVGGSTWNKIGTFTFSGTVADSIVITDQATAGTTTTYIVVDGIRIVSYDRSSAGSGLEASSSPSSFLLEQNFPNPFNGQTMLTYRLPRRAWVRLSVADLLGRTIRILVDGEQLAGIHSIAFRANELATGIYIYRLSAGEYVDARKMIFTK